MNKFRIFDSSQKRYVTDDAEWVVYKNGKIGINGSVLQRNDFILEYNYFTHQCLLMLLT